LVLEAFVGPPPTQAHHAAHWDGNRLNNHVSNLRWATIQENNGDDRRRLGAGKGVRNGRAKVTDNIVRAIRLEFVGRHGDIARLARKYGVAHTTAFDIVHRRRWLHV
jgi:hypothetical protein